jgi:hypothetical protein
MELVVLEIVTERLCPLDEGASPCNFGMSIPDCFIALCTTSGIFLIVTRLTKLVNLELFPSDGNKLWELVRRGLSETPAEVIVEDGSISWNVLGPFPVSTETLGRSKCRSERMLVHRLQIPMDSFLPNFLGGSSDRGLNMPCCAPGSPWYNRPVAASRYV